MATSSHSQQPSTSASPSLTHDRPLSPPNPTPAHPPNSASTLHGNFRSSDVGTFRTSVSTASTRRPRITTVPPFARHDSIAMPDEDEDEDEDGYGYEYLGGARKSGMTLGSSQGRPSGEVSLMGRSDHDRQRSESGSGSGSGSGKDQDGQGGSPGSEAERGLTKPPPAANPNSTYRQSAVAPRRPPGAAGGASGPSDPESRWWTFTLPTKYRSRVESYLYGDAEGDARSGTGYGGERDVQRGMEKLVEGVEMNEKEGQEMRQRRPTAFGPNGQRFSTFGGHPAPSGFGASRGTNGMRMDGGMPQFEPMSVNQVQTPGWSAPWTPFKRTRTDPLDQLEALHPVAGSTSSKNNSGPLHKVKDYLLYNAFAPLVLRVLNCGFTATTLALAIRIRLVERKNDLAGVMGSSTTFAIIVSPLTLVHVLTNVYFEYFGKPIGIWSVHAKMVHTLVELLFICLWSAELSLAFDDIFTTPIECTSWTPNGRFRNIGLVDGVDVEGTTGDLLCDYQASLVSLTFVSVFLYTSVLITSLFRIFNKVSRKG